MSPIKQALAPRNRYIHAEKEREARREYVKRNGTLVGKIRGAVSDMEIYYAH
jgi:hypothetical protein